MLSKIVYGDKDNPVLLLLHGFLGSSADWQPFFPQLGKNFYCIALDLPGHGKSVGIQCNMQFLDVADTIIGQISDPFYLIGYSMGGRIALDIFQRYSSQVIDFICISASPGIEDTQQREQRFHKDQKLLPQTDKEAFLHKWYRQKLFTGIPDHPNYKQLIASRLQGNFHDMQRGLNIMSVGQQPNIWPSLQTIPRSFAYLCGELDEKYTNIGKRLQQQTLAEVVIMKSCSHMPHFQQPQFFTHFVDNYFLKANQSHV